MEPNRRHFLGTLAGLSLSPSLLAAAGLPKPKRLPISCNTYNWVTFYQRQGKVWGQDLDACIADFAQSGISAIEPSFGSSSDVVNLAPILKKYQILMPSAYVNSSLHKVDEARQSIESVLAIASEAQKLLELQIIVTNPNPVRWGSPEVKSDAELLEQSKNLEKLGAALRTRGITLAYHTHDTELLAGAREFHHVLLNTSPKNVAFCFDTHWVYRGSQNSQVAVFDMLKLYGSRVVELHLRQSVNGIWSETFGDGDIDYRRFDRELKARKLSPHLVIEQCVESKTPATMNAVEAHQKDLAVVREIFGR